MITVQYHFSIGIYSELHVFSLPLWKCYIHLYIYEINLEIIMYTNASFVRCSDFSCEIRLKFNTKAEWLFPFSSNHKRKTINS